MASGPIKQRMVHTISYATVASISARGDRTYTAASTTPAYIEKVDERIEKLAGEITNVTHKIWTETAITFETIIWLPGDTVTKPYGRRPERVKIYYTLTGAVDHYEVWLGSV